MTDLNRVILFLGLTTMGALHDYFLLKEELHWYNSNYAKKSCIIMRPIKKRA